MAVFGGDYSKYYDLLYKDKNYQQEADFIDSLLKRYGSNNPKKLLELGSGTGKHAYLLAEKGYSVDGVDQSATMLEMAGNLFSNSPYSKQVSFQKADVRNLLLNKKYDAALSLFHVMSYQTSNEDLQAVFKTVKNNVNPGGVFIFDCWYGPAVLVQQPQVRFKTFKNEALSIERVAVPTLFENNNQINVNYHVFVKDSVENTYTKLEENHLMRYLFFPEIQALCNQFDMKITMAGEWLTEHELSHHTWGACFVITL